MSAPRDITEPKEPRRAASTDVTPLPQHNEEQLEQLLRQNVWGYGCKQCNASGMDGPDACPDCRTLGIVDWQYGLAIEKLLELFEAERQATRTAVVEARIEVATEVLGIVEGHRGAKVSPYNALKTIEAICRRELAQLSTEAANREGANDPR